MRYSVDRNCYVCRNIIWIHYNFRSIQKHKTEIYMWKKIYTFSMYVSDNWLTFSVLEFCGGWKGRLSDVHLILWKRLVGQSKKKYQHRECSTVSFKKPLNIKSVTSTSSQRSRWIYSFLYICSSKEGKKCSLFDLIYLPARLMNNANICIWKC